MPHIYAYGYDYNKSIREFKLHLNVTFAPEYFKSMKYQQKMAELKQEMEALVAKYFGDEHELDIYTNHEWNIQHSHRNF